MPIPPAAAKIMAVIPTWNEAGAIGPTVARLPRALIDEIIVVDGGSTDGTQQEASGAGATVIVEQRRGYGRACQTGAEQAATRGASILLFLDGDGSDAGELASRITDPISRGDADFVIAVRSRSGREAGSMGIHQVLAGHLVGTAVGLLTGTRYRDMCAFRAIRVDRLESLGMREMTYGWNLEMQIRAAHAKLRILEVDMPYRCRIAGQSKVAGNLRGTIKASSRILQVLLRVGVRSRRQRSIS